MSGVAPAGRQGARRIVGALETAGVGLVATVPDTWIGSLVQEARRSERLRVVDVAREEEAVAVACGAALVGRRAAVAIQNAGLLNCGAVLASLVRLYRVPCFLLVSYRGDERDPVYYHVPKGQITEPTLRAWGIRHARATAGDAIRGQILAGLEFAEAAQEAFALLFSGEDLA